MKTYKIAYYIFTALLTAIILFSAGFYVFSYPQAAENFSRLGFPTYIIYPLATAKILGITAIWSNFSKTLKEWAYAGFLFNFLLALLAHINAGDGEWLPAALALFFWSGSYISYKLMRPDDS